MPAAATVDAGLARVAERRISSGSVFSTMLIDDAICAVATDGAERVVDVGCGQAPYRNLLGPTRYVPVDWQARPGGAAVVADASVLPFADASFDGVLCTEVIEHVRDERALAAELARIASPGAVLVLSAPFVHGLHEAPYDFRRLTSIGLVRTLEDAGWIVEQVAAVGGSTAVWLDGVVRTTDALVRRVLGRLLGRSSAPFRAAERASAGLQRGLGRMVLRSGRRYRSIDPGAPSPRLTLGYAVRARLPRR